MRRPDLRPRASTRWACSTRSASPDAVIDRAYDYARRITANGPLAVRKTKESVIRGLAVDMKEAYRIESAISSEVFSSEDAVEGPKAFAEKRTPEWKNR